LTEEQAFKGGTREERKTAVSSFYQVHEFTGRLALAIFSPFHPFTLPLFQLVVWHQIHKAHHSPRPLERGWG